MTYNVEIKVMPLKELLDPQGKAVMGGLANLGLTAIQDVRVGKNISVQVEADSADQAKELARAAAQKLLANPVMEYFELECRPA
ncbi:MAG TPA: phosphoribosylformylglycinamidine synthase [Chitinophagaceae bacterium]|jgi:phosphoribosylformylglycinamidine synthase|nr:phosphoribosylformylglycinamidine synthase subunit PurS [Bacteroidota bacterium]HBB57724.1 phosphoribosylformylglycinamidine synthase [Chitinophagaceae bacterium]